MSIYLTAMLESKPEFLPDVIKVLKEMVEHSRKERACLQYDLHQSTDNENIFVFYEVWESMDGLNAHNEQSYILEFLELAKIKLISEPKRYLLQKL